MKIKLHNTLLILLMLFFIIITSFGINKTVPGDDYTYFYMAKLMTKGKLFYKDFFFSHPPLHLMIITLFYKIFGFNIIALRSIGVISQLITIFFLFKLSKEKFGDSAALLCILLYSSSYLILLMSTYVYGINITVMFLVIGLYLLSKNKSILSGIFFGLAGITGLYSLVISAALIVQSFFKNRKQMLNLIIGFSLIFVLTNLFFILIFGKNYTTAVYKYHFMKPKQVGNFLTVLFKVIKENIFLALTPLLIFFIKKKNKIKNFAITILIYLVFLFILNRIFDFYFILIFPFLALIGSYTLSIIIRKYNKKNFIAALIIILCIYSYPLYNRLINYDYLDFKHQSITKFFNERTNENDVVFGDASFTPMIALMTNRDIYANIVDTNLLVFQSGVIEIEQIINYFHTSPPDYIIAKEGFGIGRIDSFVEFVNDNCKPSMLLEDEIWGNILIFNCRK